MSSKNSADLVKCRTCVKQCGVAITAAFAWTLVACVSGELGAHAKRLEACVNRLEQEHPEMTTVTRQKNCRAEVAPAPLEVPTGLVVAPIH